MKNLLIILFLIFSINLFSQTKIDSLETKLKIVNDKERIEVLNELAKEYKSSLPEKTLEYGEQALEFSKNIGYKEGEAKALVNIATAYYVYSEYNKSIEIFLAALQIFEDIEDKKNIAQTYNDIGLVYNNLSKYDESLEYYLRSMKIREKIGDKKGIAASLNNIGNVNWETGKHSTALEYYLKSLQIYEEINDKDGIAISNNNIGNIYYILKDFDKCRKHFIKSLNIYEELDKKYGIAAASNNIAFVFKVSENYHKALEYSFKSLKTSEEMEEKFGIANTSNNIGDLYFILGNHDKAYSYYKKSIKLSEEIEAKSLVRNSYLSLSKLYSLKEDYEKSLEYFKLYTEVKDSIFTEESSGKIAEMQTKYETEKKEKENEILKKDNKIQKLEINKQQNLRNSFIVISVLVLILAFVIYGRYKLEKKVHLELEKANNLIQLEKEKSDNLLLNILPEQVANDLKETNTTKPKLFKEVTILISDLVNFTKISSQMKPDHLISELNDIFTAFDVIIEQNNCERIKTIGDAYLAVCGLPIENKYHKENIVKSAIEIVTYMRKRNLKSEIKWEIRIGVHTGSVVGGVVGVKKYIYDIFGDAVNTTSRMESNSLPMMINVSESTYRNVKNKFKFIEREPLIVKGKGEMKMYFVDC